LTRKQTGPLYIQIREQIEQAITSRVLKPGDKLPSVASLSKEIGVTQATIRRAMEDLSKKGYTKCHVGRGTFIEALEKNLIKFHKSFLGADIIRTVLAKTLRGLKSNLLHTVFDAEFLKAYMS
jgi:DNA-binding transcriptional regulator YhcF (GntR family)